jgi:hypothetical protein
MPISARNWVAVAALAALAGCSSREGGPPRLTGSGKLQAGVERAAVGTGGTLYCTASSRGMMGGDQNVLQIIEPSGSFGDKVKLEPATAEIKAIAANGRGKLYLGVKDGGKDQIWVLPEDARGDKVTPQAKLTPDLPASINGLVVGREGDVLYALCGDNWVVKVKTDGSVAQKIELPGDSRPEEGAVDTAGNLYVRRSSGPVVKIKPDGTLDKAWAQSAAAAQESVQALAVDSRGVVYIAASDGDIRLRGYDASGTLLFNIVEEALDRTPERLLIGRDGRLYALLGQKMLVFRP